MSSVVPDVELITTEEVAQMMRVPTSTVRYWRHIGTGPVGFRVGRRVVYRADAVHEWLEQQQKSQGRPA